MKWMRYFNLLLVLFCYSLQAEQKNVKNVTIEKQLSMAFLNYLAEMTEVDGKLVGPQDMTDKRCLSPAEHRELREDNDDATNRSQQSEISKDKTKPDTKSDTSKQECPNND